MTTNNAAHVGEVQRTSFPSYAFPLLGRDEELAHVHAILGSSHTRLLTLVGPAGVGKTRLAVAAAETLHPELSQHTWFVDLAPVTDPAAVLQSVARSLGVRSGLHEGGHDELRSALGTDRVLLVLDNFEQVLSAAPTVTALLALASGVRILVTSREHLRLQSEQRLLLQPLALPAPHDLADLAACARSPAVNLFVSRARAAKFDFHLTADNAQDVVRLCARLDALPLALELAAARVSLMSPSAMLARLEDHRALPAPQEHDRPDRHRSLHDAIHWSYNLLSLEQRAVFRRLGVFPGTFSVAAAEAVGATKDLRLDALDALADLVDRSLVRAESDTPEESRFRLLETIREHASELLRETGELDETTARHAEFFYAFAQTARGHVLGEERALWLARLEREHDNLRATLRWAAQKGHSEFELMLCAILGPFWYFHGYLSEGRQWLREALQRSAGNMTLARRKALSSAGNLANRQGDYHESRKLHEEALAYDRTVGNASLDATLTNLGSSCIQLGDYEQAHAYLHEALALRHVVSDPDATAGTLSVIGELGLAAGQYERARAAFEEAITLRREAGKELASASVYVNLGLVHHHEGHNERAAELIGRGLNLARQGENKVIQTHAHLWLGRIMSRTAQLASAAEHLRAGFSLARAMGDRPQLTLALCSLADFAALTQRPELAARLLGCVTTLRSGASYYDEEYEAARQAVQRALTPARWRAAWLQGQAEPLEHAAGEALFWNAEATHQKAAGGLQVQLSKREEQVLKLLVAGFADKQISEELHIAERTVRYHVASILNKLGAGTRTHAGAIAAERGLA